MMCSLMGQIASYLNCVSAWFTELGVKVAPNVVTGNGMDFLVGRVAYTFGLQVTMYSTQCETTF